jgi:NADPH2:quinone reductase
MRTSAAGLNFIDTYYRSGLYPVELPTGLGAEAAGVIEAVGEGVEHLAPGDRVATFGPDLGAYSTHRNVAAKSLFKLPDDITDEVAAAAMLKGCTAEYLVDRTATIHTGDWILVHAAAGGVGLILVQWLKARGARVIGTVGNVAKAKIAQKAGADHIVQYSSEDIAKRVGEITNGQGVRVTYDGVGSATWDASLASTGVRGLVVSFGNASGPVTGVSLSVLAAKGALYCTRPRLHYYYSRPAERAAGVRSLWDMIRSGRVRITVGQRYPLADAQQAHRDLEARKTTGSSLLIP